MSNNGITKTQIGVLAVSAGVCVANIYYSQPILNTIGQDLSLDEHQVGYLPVLSQAGYGLGLLLVTPLGDKLERKNLIIWLQVLLMAALGGMTVVSSPIILYVLSFLLGFFAVATQVMVPMAAAMATRDKGKVVGIVFTGLLVGILGARIFSGYIAEWFSWRHVFGISAGLLAVTTLLVGLLLPRIPAVYDGHYGALLASTLVQFKRFARLRRLSALGMFMFGTFCSFWTTLTFHLSGDPFYYESDTIGLFGVLAIGGALAAPAFGRMADKGNPAKNQVFTVLLLLGSILLIQWLPHSVVAFLVATVLLDVGMQATQVSTLAQIYTLDESAHSRINTMYMTMMFIGGAVGTWVGVTCWALGGWQLVCWQMLLWASVALLVALWGYRREKARRMSLMEG